MGRKRRLTIYNTSHSKRYYMWLITYIRLIIMAKGFKLNDVFDLIGE